MATGTKLMKEINDQFLICKICFEPYKDPKTLICLHTFCCECIQKHTEAENSRPSRYNLYSRYVTCPLCRKKTEIPSGGIRKLQDNFLVSNLTEVINKRVCKKIPSCEICHTIRPRSNEACSKCLECNKFLCGGCVELHMTTKVTQKHSLIDIEGEKDIECKAHPEEIVRFYCEPCDACICVVCTFQEHRDHEICSFNDGFTKYKETLVELLDKCKERLGGVANRVKLIDKYELLMKEIRERIRDIAIDYMSQVRARERELIKKVDDLFGNDVLEFIQNKEWLQENLDNLQSTCNLTEIIMKDKGVEMMLLKRELQAKFAHLLDSKLPTVPENLPEDVRFIPGDVKLGYISINGELEGPSRRKFDPCDGVDESTQTMLKEFSDSVTSMSADMSVCLKSGDTQTEPVQTSTRETSTVVKETRSRGVLAYLNDSKTKGTMTVSKDFRSAKIQTEKLQMYDQTCMTSIPSIPPPLSKGDNWSQPGSSGATSGCDINSSNYRQSRWIRSRKIQTEISAIDNTEDDNSFRNGTLMACGDMLNGHTEVNGTGESLKYRDRGAVNGSRSTSAPKMTDKETSPGRVLQKDQSVMVSPLSAGIETQTPIIRTKNSAIATDYEGQQHKGVSTVFVELIDSGTTTPHITSESKVTWTEKTMTSDRAMCTVSPSLKEISTSTQQIEHGDYGVQVRPKQRTVATNIRPCKTATQECQTDLPSTEQPSVNGNAEPVSSNIAKAIQCASVCVGTESLDVLTKSIDRLSFMCMESSTETLDVRVCDKETTTNPTPCKDNWTLTFKPQYMDTGVSPPTPATFDAGVSTNAVITMEQATYTDVRTYKEMGVATSIVNVESETMTERIQTLDAQTCIEIQTDDTETSTDVVEMMDEISMAQLCSCKEDVQTECKEIQCGTSKLTDGNLVNSSLDDSFNNSQSDILECVRCEYHSHEEKQFMDSGTMPQKQETQEVGTMALSIYAATDLRDADTQTNEVKTTDKSVTAALESAEPSPNLLVYSDAATSTESLPYIGLLSEIDVDDLIVFPEAQFDLVSDYSSSDYDVEMVDDETSTDWLDGIETGTQTFIPSGASTPVSEDQSEFFRNVGVNTHTKLTFEKETCTPIRHLFSKGTMTFYVSRTDKATCTTNQSRYLAESSKFGGRVASTSKHRVSDKDTMTSKAEQRDACVETDPRLLDGKISECITKLRSVSDRLNSPTMRQNSDSDVFFDKSFSIRRLGSDSSEMTSSFVLSDSSSSLRDGKSSPISPVEKSEEERQKQLQQLLAETQSVRKPKESKSGNRKEIAPSSIDRKRSPSANSRPQTPKPHIPEKPESLKVKPNSEGQPPPSPTPIKSILKTTSSSQAAKCVVPRETVSTPATPVVKPRKSLSKTPEKIEIDTSKYTINPETKEGKPDPQVLGNKLKELTVDQEKDTEPNATTPVQLRKKLDVPKRKPQPITTLKGKKAEDYNSYKTRSLPRQFTTENSPLSALIIQTPPSRLPLLRYNSAPGRIATVPTHTLLKKAGQSPPLRTAQQRQASPSKIPISNRQCSPEKPMQDVYAAPKSKSHQKPSLPAISETRTPSSCSDSSDVSFLSLTSGDSMNLSLTPSIGTVSSETSENIASSSKAGASQATAEPSVAASPTSKVQPKREKTGFMQRLFSKKKKEAEQKPEIVHTTSKWTPPPKPEPEPPKVQIPNKSRPFVYVRSRIFSIQHDTEDEKKIKEEEEKKQKEEEKKREEERLRKEKEKKAKTKSKGKKPPSSPSLKPSKKANRLSRDTDSDLSDCQAGATSLDVPTDPFRM